MLNTGLPRWVLQPILRVTSQQQQEEDIRTAVYDTSTAVQDTYFIIITITMDHGKVYYFGEGLFYTNFSTTASGFLIFL